jgi:hypothetical protein
MVQPYSHTTLLQTRSSQKDGDARDRSIPGIAIFDLAWLILLGAWKQGRLPRHIR